MYKVLKSGYNKNIKDMKKEIDIMYTTIELDGKTFPCYKQGNMTLVNMTPHEVRYYGKGREPLSIPPSGLPPIRLSEKNEDEFVKEGFSFTRKVYSEAENLPGKKDGVYYIVSKMVLDAVQRADLLAPDTGNGAVRDVDGSETGKVGAILGTTRFVFI